MSRLLATAHRLLRAGYAPPPAPALDVRCRWPDGRTTTAANASQSRWLQERIAGGVTALCPTYVGSMPLDEQRATVGHLARRFAAAVRETGTGPGLFIVGMQWQPGEEQEAMARLNDLLDTARAHGDCVGLTLRGPGKIRTINAALELASHGRPRGWLWFDDDVRLQPDALRQILARFAERGFTGAVGATCRPTRTPRLGPALLARGKRLTAPVQQYPHACCMVVAADVLRGGIPDRFISDDGYVLHRLLDRRAARPLTALEVIPSAVCEFRARPTMLGVLRTQHRLVYCHLTTVAEMPLDTATFYLRRMLFADLFAGRRPGVSVHRTALTRVLKAGHCAWVGVVAASLIVRGAIGRPLTHVPWGRGIGGAHVPDLSR